MPYVSWRDSSLGIFPRCLYLSTGVSTRHQSINVLSPIAQFIYVLCCEYRYRYGRQFRLNCYRTGVGNTTDRSKTKQPHCKLNAFIRKTIITANKLKIVNLLVLHSIRVVEGRRGHGRQRGLAQRHEGVVAAPHGSPVMLHRPRTC